jgi:hypothetical protein
VAETAELAALVAVTVTVCWLMIEDGAVAVEMLPTVGLIDQLTAVFDIPETVA